MLLQLNTSQMPVKQFNQNLFKVCLCTSLLSDLKLWFYQTLKEGEESQIVSRCLVLMWELFGAAEAPGRTEHLFLLPLPFCKSVNLTEKVAISAFFCGNSLTSWHSFVVMVCLKHGFVSFPLGGLYIFLPKFISLALRALQIPFIHS